MPRFFMRIGRVLVVLSFGWILRPGPKPAATLALFGDVMLGRGIADAGTPPDDVMGVMGARLSRADLVLGNLESPLTSAPAEGISDDILCAPPGQREILAAVGMDLLSLANNHQRDCGAKGLEDTRELLASAGIQPIGPETVAVFREVNSIRLAFLALDDVSTPISLEAATGAIAEARASGAFVVVSIHWGAEYRGAASARQRAVAEALTQAGAGLIWGHHPHVLQPAERLTCPLSRGCLVLYSLGNAVFDQAGLRDTRRSAMVMARLDEDGVIEARAVPFVIDVRQGRLVEPGPRDVSVVMARLGPEILPDRTDSSR